MKNIVILVVFSFILNTNMMRGQTLNDYRWQKRIILLGDTSIEFIKAKKAYQALYKVSSELMERNLLVFFIKDNILYDEMGEPIGYEPYLKLENDFEGVVLIGKDGGSKLTAPYPIALEKLFSVIDGMPMRKAEMNNRIP